MSSRDTATCTRSTRSRMAARPGSGPRISGPPGSPPAMGMAIADGPPSSMTPRLRAPSRPCSMRTSTPVAATRSPCRSPRWTRFRHRPSFPHGVRLSKGPSDPHACSSPPTTRSIPVASWTPWRPRRTACGSRRSTSTRRGETHRTRWSRRRSRRRAAASPCGSYSMGAGGRSGKVPPGTIGSSNASTAERGTRAWTWRLGFWNREAASSGSTTRASSSTDAPSSCRA